MHLIHLLVDIWYAVLCSFSRSEEYKLSFLLNFKNFYERKTEYLFNGFIRRLKTLYYILYLYFFLSSPLKFRMVNSGQCYTVLTTEYAIAVTM